MIRSALLITRKDLRLILARSAGLSQALLLGLLLIFLFSLSLQTGDKLSTQEASTMFWISSVFCQVLIFQMLYGAEEQNGTHMGLILLPAPIQNIWLGKFLAGFVLLLLSQIVFIPAMFVFLGQSISNTLIHAIVGIILVDIGICACGSLLGALCVGQTGKESILSIILFPLLIPLLLSAIRLTETGLNPINAVDATLNMQEIMQWHGLAAAFDALFIAASLLLFPFLYTGDHS